MKEQIKGLLMLTALILGIYGLACIAEFISNVITMEILSKIIYTTGIITAIVLIRKERRN